MGQVQVTWVQNMQFVGTDSTKHSVVLSGSDDGTGMKPSELLLVALGGCTGYDVVSILGKKRQKLTGLRMRSAASTQRAAWSFHTITHHTNVWWQGLERRRWSRRSNSRKRNTVRTATWLTRPRLPTTSISWTSGSLWSSLKRSKGRVRA